MNADDGRGSTVVTPPNEKNGLVGERRRRRRRKRERERGALGHRVIFLFRPSNKKLLVFCSPEPFSSPDFDTRPSVNAVLGVSTPGGAAFEGHTGSQRQPLAFLDAAPAHRSASGSHCLYGRGEVSFHSISNRLAQAGRACYIVTKGGIWKGRLERARARENGAREL